MNFKDLNEPLKVDFKLQPDITYTADIRLSEATRDHTKLYNRDKADQHPISAITGLEDALEGLSDDITAENNRAIEAEETLDNKIDSEADTRAEEITHVEGLISDEETRAKGVEQELADSIDSNHQAISNHVSDKDNPHEVTKAQVGLGNVDNTSDLNKPVSTATQTALDGKVDKVSFANRVYGTDANGNQTTYDKGSFGQVDDVQVGGVSVVTNKIAELGTMASEMADDYYTASQIDTALDGKEDTISDLNTIRSNASDGEAAYTTIQTFGNIVTHNVSEFATSTQGALADTALQPNDNISELTNNLSYQTATQVANSIAVETGNRESADNNLQSQIDAIVSASDVFDVVGTYAELQAYDISSVPVNDIIKVLEDSTHAGAATYYRCVETGGVKSWSYIGSEGAYYTKAEADSNFVPQTRTVNSKALSSDITLTASDVGALPSSTVIPTVNDATITIQKNGDTVGTFTLNQSSNETVNLTVPTNTSELTNDSGFITGISSSDVTTALGYTPADDDDVVHKTGAETIAGEKRFTGIQKLEGNTVKRLNTTRGTNPSSTQYANIYISDSTNQVGDNTAFGNFRTLIAQTGTVRSIVQAFKNTTAGTNYSVSLEAIYDTPNNNYFLRLGGNPLSTDMNYSLSRVTSSTTLNTIPTMGWVNNPETSTNVVHRSGHEPIGGEKTFTGNIVRRFGTTVDGANHYNTALVFRNSDNETTGFVRNVYYSDNSIVTGLQTPRTIDGVTKYANIEVGIKEDGTIFTSAPTPATGSNSNDIATTAYVKAQGYVDTTSNQTIAGEKTFTGYIKGQAANYTNHAIKLGSGGVDYMDFYEYGGIWNFYKSRSGTNTLVGKIAELTTSTNDETLATTNWVNNKGYALDSGVVKTSGDQNIAGVKKFANNHSLVVRNPNITKGTNPSARQYWNIGFTDTNSADYKDRLGVIECYLDANGNSQMQIKAYKNEAQSTATEYIGVTYPASGSAYTYAPTPATSDSSTKIATTAFVNNWVNANTSEVDVVTAYSLGQNGYIKFSNGVIIQWGTTTSAAAATAITLPTAFSNTDYSVTITSVGNSGVYQRLISSSTPKSTTGFTTYASGGAASLNFSWQAIGY